ENGTAYAEQALDQPYVTSARAQGGLAGFMHPYLNWPRTPAAAASTLIALDAALGLGDFYDITSLYSDELGSAAFYYRLLNAGFRLPATGGTDNFSDVWRDPPPGSDRTFAQIEGPLTMRSWFDAIRRGRTFTSTGPLIFLEVDGHKPGDEITVAGSGPRSVRVKAEAMSITPLDSLQIIVNGDVARTVAATDKSRVSFDGSVDVPEGGWVAARVLGPSSKYIGDDYAFAHTSPVYVVRGGKRYVNAEDVRFLAQTVDAIWARVERSRWKSEESKERFRAAVDSARAVYEKIGKE
ncbi:MAG TPA: CehA/McbA family metallohydrolase, partial [Gemmatimonadaceae bacterium]